ncbi:MAG: hypothetical protein GF330_13045 [Candidatus Eisenbacteria bacterium]|nr:hypothetical protein [Candidatus Eisenbacteria bacterium]
MDGIASAGATHRDGTASARAVHTNRTSRSLLLLWLLTAGTSPPAAQPIDREPAPEPYLLADRPIRIDPGGTGERSLTEVVAWAAMQESAVHLQLRPGDYHLSPSDYVDPTCGNCEDPDRPVPATLGLRIRGARVHLLGLGEDPSQVRIHTHAGYGLLFEDCADCRLEGVTITGGVRDTSGRATDAAVVVRRSRVTIHDCHIAENLGDSATVAQTVVGIMGICGRDGARITVTDCEIRRNSWDGVALFRDASARIANCVIDGGDRGAGGASCGGRGVGIGVTWNARAEIVGNLVARYWKGIGIFVDAEARVLENVIEEMRTWGIAFWDADRGHPYAEIAWNAIHRTGACGISVTRGLPGGRLDSRIAHNAIVRSGQDARYDPDDRYCLQEALAVHARHPEMTIAENLCFQNREAGDQTGQSDLTHDAFVRAVQPLIERLGARAATRQSAFRQEFAPRAPR